MEWCLPPTHESAAALRRELTQYLERHAVPGADLSGAQIVISELLTNSVEHSGSMIWVSIDWRSSHPVVTVHDLGPDFERPDGTVATDVPNGRGLLMVDALSVDYSSIRKSAGGNIARAVLDVERASTPAPTASVDSSVGRLPHLDEADDDGYFDRESFLRALVVDLANHIELEYGPAAAEDAVSRIGTSIGRQMEAAFRAKRGITGSLTSEQLIELALGLKKALSGDFFVVSSEDDKIVFGNRACPFGDSVQKAPSLCRMTSSVFGGIAARSAGRDASIQLEERIAVGDAGCRAVVRLDADRTDVDVDATVYAADGDSQP